MSRRGRAIAAWVLADGTVTKAAGDGSPSRLLTVCEMAAGGQRAVEALRRQNKQVRELGREMRELRKIAESLMPISAGPRARTAADILRETAALAAAEAAQRREQSYLAQFQPDDGTWRAPLTPRNGYSSPRVGHQQQPDIPEGHPG